MIFNIAFNPIKQIVLNKNAEVRNPGFSIFIYCIVDTP